MILKVYLFPPFDSCSSKARDYKNHGDRTLQVLLLSLLHRFLFAFPYLLGAYHLPDTVPGLFSKCSRSTIISYILPDCPVSEGKLLAAREVGNFSVIVLWDTGAEAGRKPGSQTAQHLLPF